MRTNPHIFGSKEYNYLQIKPILDITYGIWQLKPKIRASIIFKPTENTYNNSSYIIQSFIQNKRLKRDGLLVFRKVTNKCREKCMSPWNTKRGYYNYIPVITQMLSGTM